MYTHICVLMCIYIYIYIDRYIHIHKKTCMHTLERCGAGSERKDASDTSRHASIVYRMP